jgi:hypothetical protein
MRLIRVFPRRTRATPNDALCYPGPPDLLAEADEVHVDCTFTWDKPGAERLAEQWRVVAPVKVGGVAYGNPGQEFVPGRYIKHGYGFTSRGCPRRCWFCSVWKRDPVPRLLPVLDCWNIRTRWSMARSAHRQPPFARALRLATAARSSVGDASIILLSWLFSLTKLTCASRN